MQRAITTQQAISTQASSAIYARQGGTAISNQLSIVLLLAGYDASSCLPT